LAIRGDFVLRASDIEIVVLECQNGIGKRFVFIVCERHPVPVAVIPIEEPVILRRPARDFPALLGYKDRLFGVGHPEGIDIPRPALQGSIREPLAIWREVGQVLFTFTGNEGLGKGAIPGLDLG
jgi:hypothetical protein